MTENSGACSRLCRCLRHKSGNDKRPNGNCALQDEQPAMDSPGLHVGFGYAGKRGLPDRHGAAFRVDSLAALGLLGDLPFVRRHFEDTSLHRAKLSP